MPLGASTRLWWITTKPLPSFLQQLSPAFWASSRLVKLRYFMKHETVGVPLWRQLQATASVIAAVRAGASGTAAVEAVSSDLRPGVQALAFHVWRNLGRAEALRDQLARKRPPAPVDALLCVALALVWQEDRRALRWIHLGQPNCGGRQANPWLGTTCQFSQCVLEALSA